MTTSIRDLDDELDRVLAGASITTGHTPLIRMPGGRDNQLYATIAGGRHLVVKIPRTGRVRYGVAAWVAGALAQAQVPAPAVLGYSELLCVETRCPGSSLGDPDRPPQDPHADDHGLAVAAGQVLRRIHTVPVTGFGRLDTSGTGLRPSLRSWLPELPVLPTAVDWDLHALRAAGAADAAPPRQPAVGHPGAPAARGLDRSPRHHPRR